MASTIWSSKRATGKSAPCTIFSTTALSPRQIANKAYTLGCKKLDRDDKRSKQKYHVRERLLICNTITKAEEVLNSRTRRTNRRVMAAEDEEEHSSDEFSIKLNHNNHHEHHSPLRASADSEDEEQEEKSENIPSQTNNNDYTTSLPASNNNSSSNSLLPRDCRIAISPSSKIITSPITTII
jgi:hypothetical protein